MEISTTGQRVHAAISLGIQLDGASAIAQGLTFTDIEKMRTTCKSHRCTMEQDMTFILQACIFY